MSSSLRSNSFALFCSVYLLMHSASQPATDCILTASVPVRGANVEGKILGLLVGLAGMNDRCATCSQK